MSRRPNSYTFLISTMNESYIKLGKEVADRMCNVLDKEKSPDKVAFIIYNFIESLNALEKERNRDPLPKQLLFYFIDIIVAITDSYDWKASEKSELKSKIYDFLGILNDLE